MALRPRSSIAVIVLGIVAIVVASVIAVQPRLADAEDAVDARWKELQPALDRRYVTLTDLVNEVAEARPDLDLVDEVRDAVADWKNNTSERPTPDLEAEPAIANTVEGAAARLSRAIAASAGLSRDRDVRGALDDFTASAVSLDAFNEAVRRYDRVRGRFPGRFFAEILGFDALRTVDVPELDLELPALPPPEDDESAPPGAEDGSDDEGSEGGDAGDDASTEPPTDENGAPDA